MSRIKGTGLGLRNPFLEEVAGSDDFPVDFFEIVPEIWMSRHGKDAKLVKSLTERFPFACHGISLSLGSTDPLNESFIYDMKRFLDEYNIEIYSEHLCWSSHQGNYLYELLPIPFTEESVKHVSSRIKRVQDILERKISIENITYYSTLSNDMSEIEFFNAVVQEADCNILLDINNVYCNSVNHGYDAKDFLSKIDGSRISYSHMAGHKSITYLQSNDTMIIDSHGHDIIDPVWNLLRYAYNNLGVFPTMVERDSDIPAIDILLKEVDMIREIQNAGSTT